MLVYGEKPDVSDRECLERSGRFTRFVGGVAELLRHREHGKTARTLAICACVLGGIAAISAAKTLQSIFGVERSSLDRLTFGKAMMDRQRAGTRARTRVRGKQLENGRKRA